VNVLLDTDGPGCIHRLFTGGSEPGRPDSPGSCASTAPAPGLPGPRPGPVLDDLVVDFFDPGKDPFPPAGRGKAQGWTYPAASSRSLRAALPGAAREPRRQELGQLLQVAYTTYPRGTRVQSLAWPLPGEARERSSTSSGRPGSSAPSGPPAPPREGTLVRRRPPPLPASRSSCSSRGRRHPRAARGRLGADAGGAARPAADDALGRSREAGRGRARGTSSATLTAATARRSAACSSGSRPTRRTAAFRCRTRGGRRSPCGTTRACRSPGCASRSSPGLASLPASWGRFHATSGRRARGGRGRAAFRPAVGAGHAVLEHEGRGKYVGVLMSEDWPHEGWWARATG